MRLHKRVTIDLVRTLTKFSLGMGTYPSVRSLAVSSSNDGSVEIGIAQAAEIVEASSGEFSVLAAAVQAKSK